VHLTLTGDNDRDLRILYKRTREDIEESAGLVLEQKTDDDSEKGFIYNQFARTKY
jgi:hypothetical protein